MGVDASGHAIGAVLMQDLGKGLQPIGFISKLLNAAEQNYSTTERELLAIVHATHEWRHLLQGRQYVMQGDHKPLEAKGRCRSILRVSICRFFFTFGIDILVDHQNLYRYTMSKYRSSKSIFLKM